MPPPGPGGLAGQLEHVGPLGFPGHAVQGEQVRQVTLLHADPAVLQPADLRRRRPDHLARRLAGDAVRLTQAAQLAAERDGQRSWPAGDRVRHRPAGLGLRAGSCSGTGLDIRAPAGELMAQCPIPGGWMLPPGSTGTDNLEARPDPRSFQETIAGRRARLTPQEGS